MKSVILGSYWRDHRVLEIVKNIRLRGQNPGLLKTVLLCALALDLLTVMFHFTLKCSDLENKGRIRKNHDCSADSSGIGKRIVVLVLTTPTLDTCIGEGNARLMFSKFYLMGGEDYHLGYSGPVRMDFSVSEGSALLGSSWYPLALFAHFLYLCRKDFPLPCSKYTWTGPKVCLPDGQASVTISAFQRHSTTSP